MSDKRSSRLRRAKSTRFRIRELGVCRLTVHRSNQHIYAQVISECGSRVLVSASTTEEQFSGATCNKASASAVGQIIAERAKGAGISKVAFDRAGYRYHGRIKALADAARENGLDF